MADVKKSPRLHSQCCYIFSGPSGSMTNTFSIDNQIPRTPVLGDVRDVAPFIISHEQTWYAIFIVLGFGAIEGSNFTICFISLYLNAMKLN